jgi:hypothetical protein
MMSKFKNRSDVLETAAAGTHVKSHGKNFKPLIAAGSWTISGFHYGRSKCACCGRPICRVLQLKNESHQAGGDFDETIDIGVVCGPKVFIESCVGFYEDPTREWERQHSAWKDYINYVILCVKHEKLWKMVPDVLRTCIDIFLQEGYKAQEHSGGWWMVKDAKKRFLRSQVNPDVVPHPHKLHASSRSLLYTAKRQNVIPYHWDMKTVTRLDPETQANVSEFQLITEKDVISMST